MRKMTDKDWRELDLVGDRSILGRELLSRTEMEDEHPEDYNGPCLCKLCMSYSDI